MLFVKPHAMRSLCPITTSGATGRVSPFTFFFFQAEDGIRDLIVTGVQTCALPIYRPFHAIRDRQRCDVRGWRGPFTAESHSPAADPFWLLDVHRAEPRHRRLQVDDRDRKSGV